MKVLLTTPPQPMSSILPGRYQAFSKFLKLLGGNKPILGIQPPYGLMYLSSCLRKAGHQVSLIDGLRSSLDAILARIADENTELVGISSVTWNWQEAGNLAQSIHERFPRVKLAVGGAHVNAERGKVLADCASLDYAFYGDAEESFCEVVSTLSDGKPPIPGDGFAFRKGEKIIAADEDAIIRRLDDLPYPDRDSLGFEAYRPSPQSYRRLPFTAVFGSRGCPGTCTFCHTDGRIRLRSAEDILEEIALLQERHGIREVLFYDDNFTLSRKRVLAICDGLSRRGMELSWAANARVDTLDPELLGRMKKAGCWRLLLGIESGSQRILDRIDKKITPGQVRRAVEMIRAAGIQTYGMFIFGFPTETYREGLETIALMKSLPLDFVNVASLTPFPGTAIHNEVAGEAGFKGFEHMNMYDIAYVPGTMAESQLQDLLKRSLREFYLRAPYVLRQLGNIRGPADFLRYLRGSAIVFLR